MFFDGKVGNKRVVSLRGSASAAPKSKKDLLEESQRLREKREQDRRRTQQAINAQRLARRFLAERRAVRASFLSLEGELSPSHSQGERELLQVLLRFTFLYNTHRRYERFAACVAAKKKTSSSSSVSVSVCAALTEERERLLRAVQAATLAGLSLFATHTDALMTEISLHDIGVVRLCKLVEISLVERTERNDEFVCTLLSSLSNNEHMSSLLYYVTLRNAPLFARTLRERVLGAQKDPLIALTQSALLRVFERNTYTLTPTLTSTHERLALELIQHILTIPSLSKHNSLTSLTLSLFSRIPLSMWEVVFTHTHTLAAHTESDKLFLLANLLSASVLCDSAERESLLLRGLSVVLLRSEDSLLTLTHTLREQEFPAMYVKERETVRALCESELSREMSASVSVLCERVCHECTEVVSEEVFAEFRFAENHRKLDYRLAVLQRALCLRDSLSRALTQHTLTQTALPQHTPVSHSQGVRERESLSHVLRELIRPQLLVRLFDSFLPTQHAHTTSPAQTTHMEMSVSLISLTAHMLVLSPTVLTHKHSTQTHAEHALKLSSFRAQILQSLAFASTQHTTHTGTREISLISRLWYFIRTTFDTDTLAHFLRSDTQTFLSHANTLTIAQRLTLTPQELLSLLLSTLVVWASLFTYTLNALDDDELLCEQRVCSLSELTECVSFLRDLTYKLYCVDAVCEMNAQFLFLTPQSALPHVLNTSTLLTHACATQCTTLFHLLCLRNERRRFLLPTHILWASVNANDTQLADNTTTSHNETVPLHVTSKLEEEGDFELKTGSMKTVLALAPQVIPFSQRVKLFHDLVVRDKTKYTQSHNRFDLWTEFTDHTPPTHISLRRAHLIDDAVAQMHLQRAAHTLKGRVQVSFISEQGLAEAGIDGGGLFKEFLDSIAKLVCDPAYGLFSLTSEQQLVPNAASQRVHGERHLTLFEFVGKIVGKALYERILFESELSPIFLSSLLGRANQLDDLSQCDGALYRSLMDLKRRANAGENIEQFGMFFEYSRAVPVSPTNTQKEIITENIKPHGGEIAVTNANVREYIILLAHHVQNSLVRPQSRAFLRGLRALIPLDWIRMFTAHELQSVIGGDRRKIDIADMQKHTVYHGYTEGDAYIQAFWRIVEEMDVEDQSHLLKFITSCPRQPLLGFAQLTPRLGIQRVHAHEDPVIEASILASDRPAIAATGRLPTAATCMNLLKLPLYNSEEVLREKLLYAIRSKSGFELS